jgi:hypothetical protein
MCEIEPYREAVLINIIPPKSDPARLTIRDAVRDTYPKARLCQDIYDSYLGENHVPCHEDDNIPPPADSDPKQDDGDSAAGPSNATRQRAKQSKFTSRHSALIALAFMSFVTRAVRTVNPISRDPPLHNTFKLSCDTPGATFVAYTATSMVCAMSEDFAYNSAFLPPEPQFQRDARQRPDSDKWIKAEDKEIATLQDMNTFEVVDRPSRAEDYDPLPLRFVYELKIEDGNFDKAIHKARLVMRGNLQYESEYGETYAPTAKLWTIRTLVALAAQEGLMLKTGEEKCVVYTPYYFSLSAWAEVRL